MKKWFSLILSIMLILNSFCTIAGAIYEDSPVLDDYFEGWHIVDVTGNSRFSSVSSKYYYQHESGFSTTYDCYNELDKAQQIIYDAVVSSPGKLSVTINFDYGVFSRANWNSEYFSEVMDAICCDRPDIFYHAGFGVSGGIPYDNSYMKSLTYNIGVYDTSLYTPDNLPGYYSALMTSLKNVPVDLSNRYNFIKSVHDYLADTVYYPDLSTSDYVMSAHDAYGALVEGRAVCQGYSDAIKLICDYYHIPCVCISGTSGGGGHMWNAIQMDDGKWYFIDCTWDDQESRTYYDFFLVGSGTTSSYVFGGAAFGDEHINDADIPMPLPRLDYSSSAYNRNQNHNTKFAATYNCAPDFDDNYLYLSVFEAGKSNVYYNGIYVPVNSFSNNETFSAPSGTNSSEEEWTMVLLADLNSDGECDAQDYSEAVNLLFTDDVIDTTAERACDINLDGYIDVLDVAVIARASSGLNTDIILE